MSPLAALADALLPAHDGLPGAGELDLERAFAARGDLRAPAQRGLELLHFNGGNDAHADSANAQPTGDTDALVAAFTRLAELDPEAHAALALLICAVYYADARVCEALGYHGPAAAERPDLVAEDAELQPLIATVAARGQRFRDVPANRRA